MSTGTRRNAFQVPKPSASAPSASGPAAMAAHAQIGEAAAARSARPPAPAISPDSADHHRSGPDGVDALVRVGELGG
ncbi:hypothetical protein AB0J43_40600, partial [Nonomuraea fuscirosea]